MRKQMIENAAFEVATQVRAVEDSIENALAEIAELQARMIHARGVTRVATATGHEALQHVAHAMQGLVNARGGMADAHMVLKETQKSVPGLRATSFGDEECPPMEGAANLRVVA